MRHSTLSVVSMAAPGRGVKRVCVVLVSIAMLVTGQTFRSAPRAVADPPAPMATISGTVVDSTTDAALANVRITDASAGSLTTTTDATGHYALTVAPGDHVLTAALHGYVADTSPLATLADGQTTDLNFSLVQYASASGVVTAGGTSTGIGSVVVSFFDAATSDPQPPDHSLDVFRWPVGRRPAPARDVQGSVQCLGDRLRVVLVRRQGDAN